MAKQGKLKIIPLGGLGEVGKNMTAYEFDHKIIIVDAGIMFPENDMLGIDYIIPDFAYVRERAEQVVGIIITHGHEDHIGAIPHVVRDIPAPVYATPLTRGLIEVKLARGGASDKVQLNTVQAGRDVWSWAPSRSSSSTSRTPFRTRSAWASPRRPDWSSTRATSSSIFRPWTAGRPTTPSWPSFRSAASTCCFRTRPTPNDPDGRLPKW